MNQLTTAGGSEILKFWSEVGRSGKELHITVIEEQLEMLCIQSELTQALAHPAGHCVVR